LILVLVKGVTSYLKDNTDILGDANLFALRCRARVAT